MKKLFKALAVIGVSAALCAPLAACGEDTAKTEQEKIYDAYVVYAEAAGEEPLSYEEWLESVQGEKGDKGDKGDKGVGISDITYSYGYNAESDYFYTEITFKLSNDETKVVIVPSAMNPEATYEAASAEAFEELMAKNAGSVLLTEDISIEHLSVKHDFEINLGGNKLSITGSASNEVEGASLAISNGDLDISGATSINANLRVGQNSSLTLDHVTYTATGAAIWSQGQYATVDIISSTITTSGAYGIGTNATTNSGKTDNLYRDVEISIVDSTVTTDSSDHDNCAVLLNVPGKLTIENSTITGDRNAVIVRAGVATIKDSELILTGDFKPSTEQEGYYNGNWGSGNEVPMSVLLIGNRNSTYFADAVCTLSGAMTVKSNQQSSEGKTISPIYVYENATVHAGVNDGKPFATKLDYSRATGITSEMIVRGTGTQEVEIIAPAAAADEQA